jgi:hypothetical protein
MSEGKISQVVNVALFGATLLGLGSLLGVQLARSSGQPEISDEENRTLAPLPQISGAAILDGSFMTGVDEWIADHFAARQQFMDLHFWLEAKRGFHADDEVAFYAVDIDTDAELEPLADDNVMLELELEPLGEDEPELLAEPDEPEDAEADEPSSIVKTGGILVADGRAMQLFAGGPRGSRKYAKVLNEYASALQGKATVYSLIVPTAQTFYLPKSYEGRVRHEPPNINATSAMLDPAVVRVDVVGSLLGHEDEYIYFRTDHHWTARGAYYAYTAFCQAAGFVPIPLESMELGTISPFRGSLYRYTRDQKLHRKPDFVEYFVPPVEIEVARGAKAEPKPDAIIRRESKGYGAFLGGDHALLIAHTQNNTGRRGLLIKNSYGNPFAVFLAAHYDTLLIVDYRKYDGSVLELVDEYQITDLIILNGAITSNAKPHIARLAHLLKGSKAERLDD